MKHATQAANTEMKHVVVDTSVALQWIVKQEHVEAADSLFLAGNAGTSTLYVPALWLWECANALLKYCKADWLNLLDLDDYFAVLRYPNPNIDSLPTVAVQKDIALLAFAHGLSFTMSRIWNLRCAAKSP